MSRSSYPGRVITALLALSALSPASAQVTIHTGRQTASSTEVTRAPDAQWTGLPMYDPLQLEPPAPPQPPTTSVGITIPLNSGVLAAGPENDGNGIYLSIPQKGNFLGFSVELSVADSLMGSSGDNLRPEFLNYLANIYARAGVGPVIRVGGNTQDSSTLVPDGFGGGDYIEKSRAEASGPTDTPAVSYSPMLLYAMSNISSLVHAEWYFGLAFNESDVSGNWENVPVAAQYAESILGPYLKGMPLGNEPDLYADHGKRQPGWGLDNYNSEWRDMSTRVLDAFSGPDSIFIGPSTCCSREGFGLADVINSGWLSNNIDRISQVSVQRYPNNNCRISGQEVTPQEVFPTYLNHGGITAIVQNEYAADMAMIQGVGKEVVMLETNTAACGGFPGVSTSFGAAVWLVDWSLQLAQTNFSQALMHVGGQNVYYNPFTPPPGNMANIYQWTTGAVYYSTLVVAETFGQSNVSRIADLRVGGDNADLHPAYAVYENDTPTRVVLFNYVSDPSGASAYTAQVALGEGSNVGQVHVRYFLAPSVSEHDDITWAGQTTGGSYSSDGRLHGNVSTTTIPCNGGVCDIPVPAPAIALVFLSDQALADSSPHEGLGTAASGFTTTIIGTGSATVAVGALETSNGQNGPDGMDGRNNRATGGAAGRADVRGVVGVMGVAVWVVVAGMVLVKLERQL